MDATLRHEFAVEMHGISRAELIQTEPGSRHGPGTRNGSCEKPKMP